MGNWTLARVVASRDSTFIYIIDIFLKNSIKICIIIPLTANLPFYILRDALGKMGILEKL